MFKKTLFLLVLFNSFLLVAQEDNYKELEIKALAIKNKVQYEYPTNNVWENVNVGDILHKKAIIKTGFNSNATFSFGKSRVVMGPITRITVEQAVSNLSEDAETSIFIDRGKTFCTVNSERKDRKINFTVRSPVAAASVRGTKFYFYSNGYIKCYEGSVSVSKSDRDHSRFYPNEEFGNSVPKEPKYEQIIHSGQYSEFDHGKPESPKDFMKPEPKNNNLEPPDNKLEEPPEGFRNREPRNEFDIHKRDHDIGPDRNRPEFPRDVPKPDTPSHKDPIIAPDNKGNKLPPPPKVNK